MACQIKRTDNGTISKVTAPNGKPSILYNSLVNSIASSSVTRNVIESDPYVSSVMDTSYIKDNTAEELALAAWSKAYTIDFMDSFGYWKEEKLPNTDSNGEPTVDMLFPESVFKNINTERQYQKGYINENLKESEFGIRDLAARLAYRIGGNVRFESDLTKDYTGYNEGNTSVINLAKATLDTPIHEIMGHPIIRVLKDKQLSTHNLHYTKDVSNPYALLDKKGVLKLFSSRAEGVQYIEEVNSKSLYKNLLKELETGYGKEVLDRVKKEYVYKTTAELITNRFGEFGIRQGNAEYFHFDDKKQAEQEVDKLNSIKYTLEEQQEEALVQLLGELTAGKIKETKENKNLISLLKQLLKQMTDYMRSLFNSKEIEIDKLSANMTLNDLANLLAYTNSKIILPGSRVEYTTPDNQKFSTYQEASNHISKLFSESKDVDLSNVTLNAEDFNIPAHLKTFKHNNIRYSKFGDGWKKVDTSDYSANMEKVSLEEVKTAYSKEYKIRPDLLPVNKFIEKNKQYEQSKEIIETWKKENNIVYNPEEVYSRGQGFYSAIGAYSSLELDLLLQNLLQHIKDNKKAGGEFNISAFTAPVGKTLKHLGGESQVRFVIYPKSEDIKWAAPTDVYSGSVWDAAEKVSKDKKSELLGVSHTKYPSLNNVTEVSPNLASIIDERSHHHNELGIELTPTNFRLEYDETVPYEIKKLVNSVNSILDDRYGKLVKPEINNNKKLTFEEKKLMELNKAKVKPSFLYNDKWEIEGFDMEYFNSKEEAEKQLFFRKKNLKAFISDKEYFDPTFKSNLPIQPTQTNENTTSIESVRGKIIGFGLGVSEIRKDSNGKIIEARIKAENVESIDSRLSYQNGKYYLEPYDFSTFGNPDKNLEITREEYDAIIGKENKEYTEQALINTKIAKLKEVAKRYPRSLITSKLVNNQILERQYQRLGSKQDVQGFKNYVNKSTSKPSWTNTKNNCSKLV